MDSKHYTFYDEKIVTVWGYEIRHGNSSMKQMKLTYWEELQDNKENV
jgi:hypothetical protein